LKLLALVAGRDCWPPFWPNAAVCGGLGGAGPALGVGGGGGLADGCCGCCGRRGPEWGEGVEA